MADLRNGMIVFFLSTVLWLSFPLGITHCVPQVNSVLSPDNEYFTDQACSVKMAGYWPRYFWCVFVDLDSKK